MTYHLPLLTKSTIRFLLNNKITGLQASMKALQGKHYKDEAIDIAFSGYV